MMDEYKTTRWKQRYENLARAATLLEDAVAQEGLSDIERAGLIQYFEVAFELSWKTLKDYLESEGHIVKSPRETIKQAFTSDIIAEGELWLQALADRNTIAHLYDEQESKALESRIRNRYQPLIRALDSYFAQKHNA